MSLFHNEHGNATGCLCPHHQCLLDVGSLARTADKGSEVVARVHLYAFVGLVHVVDDVLLAEDDDQIFREMKHMARYEQASFHLFR